MYRGCGIVYGWDKVRSRANKVETSVVVFDEYFVVAVAEQMSKLSIRQSGNDKYLST